MPIISPPAAAEIRWRRVSIWCWTITAAAGNTLSVRIRPSLEPVSFSGRQSFQYSSPTISRQPVFSRSSAGPLPLIFERTNRLADRPKGFGGGRTGRPRIWRSFTRARASSTGSRLDLSLILPRCALPFWQRKGRTLPESLDALPPALLAWFAKYARDLPWRSGEPRDPYRVWLAEIMLQQTTVPHAAPYFETFTQRWPDVEALAAANDADVMSAWAGLGYYARARNLLKCAREVAARGGFPKTAVELQTLPGIGAYTSGAIAALAFGERAAAVDGNVERVFSRVLALKSDWALEKKNIQQTVERLVPEGNSGAFAEALMDLGATVCTPKRPACAECPIAKVCAARREGTPELYPMKPAKLERPQRYGVAYVLTHGGEIWLVRRPERGLLGGMLALPSSGWIEGAALSEPPPVKANWEDVGEVRHVFTHFSLRLRVLRAELKSKTRPEGEWMAIESVKGLPSVFAKAFRLAAAQQALSPRANLT